ncbi:hypothetical protein SHIRM173S_03126 [Streptomyces hirsutus]
MIDHHLSGVDMARACASQCEVDTEQKLAQSMVEGQQSEVELMTDLLKERGSAPRSYSSPVGCRPAAAPDRFHSSVQAAPMGVGAPSAPCLRPLPTLKAWCPRADGP